MCSQDCKCANKIYSLFSGLANFEIIMFCFQSLLWLQQQHILGSFLWISFTQKDCEPPTTCVYFYRDGVSQQDGGLDSEAWGTKHIRLAWTLLFRLLRGGSIIWGRLLPSHKKSPTPAGEGGANC